MKILISLLFSICLSFSASAQSGLMTIKVSSNTSFVTWGRLVDDSSTGLATSLPQCDVSNLTNAIHFGDNITYLSNNIGFATTNKLSRNILTNLTFGTGGTLTFYLPGVTNPVVNAITFNTNVFQSVLSQAIATNQVLLSGFVPITVLTIATAINPAGNGSTCLTSITYTERP